MRELSLRELREIEIEILKMFRDFCNENNIQYFLSNGTLLGAVKYGGFIPWDDDVDLFVPRGDYDRMLALFKDSERYKLLAFERNSAYRYPFAKLCDMTTRKVEEGYNNGAEIGVDIDIFPLDAWASDLPIAKKEVTRMKLYMFCLGLIKLGRPDSTNVLKCCATAILMGMCKLLGSEFFIRRIIKLSRKCNVSHSRYVGCKAWCIYGTKEVIPAEVFADVTYVEFEGETFPAPIGYDTYLTSLYGDYRSDPPKEKQKTHHTFKAYQL